MIYSWESTDVEDRLYALVYSILYRRLEHLWILVLKGGPGTKPPWIPRTVKFYRGQLNLTGIKWHMDFWLHPNPHIVQGSTVHSIVVGITSSWLCFKSFRFLLIFSFVLLVTEKSVLIYYGCGFVYFNLWFYQLFCVL